MLSRNRYLTAGPDRQRHQGDRRSDRRRRPADWAGAGRINMQRALMPQYRLGAPGTDARLAVAESCHQPVTFSGTMRSITSFACMFCSM